MMKRQFQTLSWLFLPAIALLFIQSKCQQESGSEASADETIFTNVSLLTMTSPEILTDQTVVIRDGKIHQFGDANDVKHAKNATVIDGSGKFLMPGISEMHAHIPVAQDGNDSLVKETLFLYLSNGITTIRGMLGNPYHLELKKQLAKGEVLSPRIYTSSPSLNGNTVQSTEEARTKVTQYQRDGYDFLKIHPGIQLDVFTELVKTAREVGIPFSGHVPNAVGIDRAIDFKYASIDHLDGYVDGLVPKEENADPNGGGLFGFNFTSQVDRSIIPDIVDRTKAAGVWVVPTQSLLVRWTSPKTGAELAAEPEMKYMGPATRIQWRSSKQNILNDPNYSPEIAETFISIRQELLRTMHEKGVGLLLGSDAPQVFNVPGFSIQHEMQSMAEAGISNYGILESGTANPAKFFGEEGKYGTIVKGAAADLLLLDANPLENIAHMQQIAGVMVGGHWMSKAEIDQRLDEIAQNYAN